MTDSALTDLLELAIANIGTAMTDTEHAFRWPVLASTAVSGGGAARTVVLRGFEQSTASLRFYTDKRSHKVSELKKNSACTLLFFDRFQMLQVRAQGHAEELTDPDLLDQLWLSISPRNKREYISISAPSTSQKSTIDVPSIEEMATLDRKNSHFCVFNVRIYSLDVLHLGRDKHQRLFAERTPKGAWRCEALSP